MATSSLARWGIFRYGRGCVGLSPMEVLALNFLIGGISLMKAVRERHQQSGVSRRVSQPSHRFHSYVAYFLKQNHPGFPHPRKT
jgi:hypothetical protein